MIRSSSRLTVASVLVFIALGVLMVAVYVRSQEWTEDEVRQDGVFLIYDLLEQTPAAERPSRLKTLAAHTWRPLSLMRPEEAKTLTGQVPAPGAWLHFEQSPSQEWVLLAFRDGHDVMAAGPMHPGIPPGAKPVGLLILAIFIPLLGGFITVRIERELAKVETASRALAAGELDARVDNERGPSRELAASFNEMADRVQRLIRSRDELVQAVSHELGSPLSRLRFHLELVAAADNLHTRDERMDAMSHELDRLDDLVAELLGFVQYDERRLAREVFDPSGMLADLAELAHLDGPEGEDVDVSVDYPDGVVEVDADPKLFQRVAENLLRNAARYAKRHTVVEVRGGPALVELTVHDDGPGIPLAQREKVLSPFVRLEADRGSKTGGVGLGLAIVQRVVERHGGKVTIEDSHLGGAAIVTTWPRRSPSDVG